MKRLSILFLVCALILQICHVMSPSARKASFLMAQEETDPGDYAPAPGETDENAAPAPGEMDENVAPVPEGTGPAPGEEELPPDQPPMPDEGDENME